MFHFRHACAVSALLIAGAMPAMAADNETAPVEPTLQHSHFAADGEAAPPVTLTLQNHHFTPAEITLPADTRVKLAVTNLDPTPAEFESDDFKAEKVLPTGKEVKIEVGPFKAGTYEFHDEYNEDVSKSQIVVK